MNSFEFRVSVIVTIDEIPGSLQPTVNSILLQSLSFRNNIQLILMDCSGQDNVKKICLDYMNEFPKNVIYNKQETDCFNVARNAGKLLATGEFINFIDAGDRWSRSSLKILMSFLTEHEEIDIACGTIRFFGTKQGLDPRSEQVSGEQIINIHQNPRVTRLSSSGALIRASALEKFEFDSEIDISEDLKLINQLILYKERFGITTKAICHINAGQKRISALKTMKVTPNYYSTALKNSLFELVRTSEEKFGSVIRYIQEIIAADLAERIILLEGCPLNQDQKIEYLGFLRQLLNKIDDQVILGPLKKNDELTRYSRAAIKQLEIKHGQPFTELIDVRLDGLYHDGQLILPNDLLEMKLVVFEIEDGFVSIHGLFDLFTLTKESTKFFLETNGESFRITESIRRQYGPQYVDPTFGEVTFFNLSIPIEDINDLSFAIELGAHKKVLSIRPDKFSQLVAGAPWSYLNLGDRLIILRTNKINSERRFFLKTLYWETRRLIRLVSRKRASVAIVRLIFWLTRPIFERQNIWLISDRFVLAGDNGEALFRFMTEHEIHHVRPVFVLSKNSVDYQRLCNMGEVIEPKSMKHLILSLHARFLISSHADANIINPFGLTQPVYRDISKFQYVFLQHGVTKEDLSDWLNRYNKNIALFVTAARPEYDSILEYAYHYSDKQVKLTGFPRWDYFMNEPKPRQLVVMPTWRQNLAGATDRNNTRAYNPEFINSGFFKQWNSLLCHPKLNELLKKYEVTLKFCLHPSSIAQAKDFASSDLVEIASRFNYHDELCRSIAMITDYSSVAFDFAYLQKPLIYFQFDQETYFSDHSRTEGYFRYNEHGFGPVCETIDGVLCQLDSILENEGRMPETYLERVNSFFWKIDKNNSERVYREILSLQESGSD